MTKNDRSRIEQHVAWVVRTLSVEAARWLFDGRTDPWFLKRIRRCTFDSDLMRTRVMFTRDVGHHTGGWLKNPDFERCLHLSLSPTPADILTPGSLLELNERSAWIWVCAFFRDAAKLTWLESAKTSEGLRIGVMHWRLFCDERWQPIKPRGEVYNTEFTEMGWKSASELGCIIESPLGANP